MYVYVSEDSFEIKDFTNERLIWKQEGVIYGDWYGGPTNDGTYTYSLQLPLSQVLVVPLIHNNHNNTTQLTPLLLKTPLALVLLILSIIFSVLLLPPFLILILLNVPHCFLPQQVPQTQLLEEGKKERIVAATELPLMLSSTTSSSLILLYMLKIILLICTTDDFGKIKCRHKFEMRASSVAV
jgi:hypothetical protein